MDWSAYTGNNPLLITKDGVIPFEQVDNLDAWLETLEQVKPVGVVIPLEIRAARRWRQELFGLELVDWLRWSAPEQIRRVPILCFGYQPLAQVLRRRPNLWLTAQGSSFVRLPAAAQNCWAMVQRFVEVVRQQQGKWEAQERDWLRLGAGGLEDAERVTYHDLANDYYAAWRLWAGYKAALRQANCTEALDSAQRVQFAWQEALLQKMRRPTFRRFQLVRRTMPYPKYPQVEQPADILRFHVQHGLHNRVRVLFVDDDLHLGLADVLLKILFSPEAEFTYKLECGNRREWVWLDSKQGFFRFVCTSDVAGAVHWLTLWDGLNLTKRAEFRLEPNHRQWQKQWTKMDQNFKWHVSNRGWQTIVLLDLRLEPAELCPGYEPASLASVRLRRAIKRESETRGREIPVIILTASRQAATYAAVMADAADADGWLVKEGPDMPEDDENSARAVQYLLERVHLFSALRDWYRPELDWSRDAVLQYAAFYRSPDRDQALQRISQVATAILNQLRDQQRPECLHGQGLMGWLQQQCRNLSALERRLVARRLVVAALLETAEWNNGEPVWNAQRFAAVMPHPPEQNVDLVAEPYQVVNFARDLWLRTSAPRLLRYLLAEEYDWLIQSFPNNSQAGSYVERLRNEVLSRAGGRP